MVMMEEKNKVLSYLPEEQDVKALVDWANPPSIRDLKKDLSEALISHSAHVAKGPIPPNIPSLYLIINFLTFDI